MRALRAHGRCTARASASKVLMAMRFWSAAALCQAEDVSFIGVAPDDHQIGRELQSSIVKGACAGTNVAKSACQAWRRRLVRACTASSVGVRGRCCRVLLQNPKTCFECALSVGTPSKL
jgi:hypothetical protein